MTTTELHTRQVFSMRNRKNCELKFNEFYKQSKDVEHLIQAAVAAMVRNAFYAGDFSYLAKNLIRDVFLNGEVPASVRHLCIYFENYFSSSEWSTVISHLYKNQAEYNQLTKADRSRIEHLRPALTSGKQTGEQKLNLKAGFYDANGKMHTWGLSNVVSNLSSKDHMDLLNILGELTIFQKNGLRQFTKVVWMDFAPDERYRNFDIRNENDSLYEAKKPADALAVKTSGKTDKNETAGKEDSTAAQSTTSTQSSADQSEQKNQSKKKKTGKTPTDHMPSWKNLTADGKKPKKEKDLKMEKALQQMTGKKKKKKRKRNRRK